MQKTALTMFSALLISGLAVQSAAASGHHAQFHRAHKTVMTVGPAVGPMTTVDEEDARALPPGHEWDPWGHWGSYYGPTVTYP